MPADGDGSHGKNELGEIEGEASLALPVEGATRAPIIERRIRASSERKETENRSQRREHES